MHQWRRVEKHVWHAAWWHGGMEQEAYFLASLGDSGLYVKIK